MAILKKVIWLVCLIAFTSDVQKVSSQRTLATFTPTIQVDASALGQSSSERVYIRNFTLSPDGTALAVLYERSSPSIRGLWLALFEIRSKRVAGSVQVELNSTSHSYLAAGQKQSVSFTSDATYLIVKDVDSISVLDAKSLTLRHKFSSSDPTLAVPMRCEIAASDSTLLVAYGTGSSFAPGFHNERRDLRSGKLLAAWSSSGLVQSISPSGKLALAPDMHSYNAGGVTMLEVLNAEDGRPVKSIDLSFAFKNRRPNETGSFVAKFIDDATVAVSPDNMVDHAGRRSGDSIDIIDVASGRVIRTLTPQRFTPTGEFAISPDLKYYATVSLGADTKSTRTENAGSGSRGFHVLIGNNQDGSQVAVVDDLDGYGLISSELMPCLSLNARVLALAQDAKISIYERG
jgi:hypothetical protein